jgi:hypothetical protein
MSAQFSAQPVLPHVQQSVYEVTSDKDADFAAEDNGDKSGFADASVDIIEAQNDDVRAADAEVYRTSAPTHG